MGKKLKQSLRQEMHSVVTNLDHRWCKAASKEMCDNLQQFTPEVGRPIKHILGWSGSSLGEPDLSEFLGKQSETATVYIPNFFDDGTVKFYKLDHHLFSANKGLEVAVVQDVEYEIEEVANTILLIPGLAFDKSGNRLGWGELHYERLLSNSKLKSIIRVGIAWSFQLVPEVPVESTDLLMDWIVTEKEVLKTGVVFE